MHFNHEYSSWMIDGRSVWMRCDWRKVAASSTYICLYTELYMFLPHSVTSFLQRCAWIWHTLSHSWCRNVCDFNTYYAINAFVAVSIHLRFGYVIPMILGSLHHVLQSYDSPLFQVHLMGYSDSGDHNPFKRPWPTGPPGKFPYIIRDLLLQDGMPHMSSSQDARYQDLLACPWYVAHPGNYVAELLPLMTLCRVRSFSLQASGHVSAYLSKETGATSEYLAC